MDAIEVDPDGRAATAQAGVTTGEYTRRVGERGLATTFGDTPTVGVVGLTLEPDAQIGFLFGSISMGQLLSLPMIVAGTVILAVAFQRKKPFRSETATGERRP